MVHYALALVVSLGVVRTALAGLAATDYPNPPLEALTDYKPKLPPAYSRRRRADRRIRRGTRAFIAIGQVRPTAAAIVAAEDERFYTHGGVDTLGVLRAAGSNLLSGGAKAEAAITMRWRATFSCPAKDAEPQRPKPYCNEDRAQPVEGQDIELY
jgi:penicillin-binding protein 1A